MLFVVFPAPSSGRSRPFTGPTKPICRFKSIPAITKRNLRDLDNMAALLRQFRIVLWSAFFLVPTGRAQTADLPTAQEFETAFSDLNRLSREVPFKIKTTEAQHFRRFLLQHRPRLADHWAGF